MNKMKITSAGNSRIREALKIIGRNIKYKHSVFSVEGPHLIEAALNAGRGIRRVFVTGYFSAKKEGDMLLSRALEHGSEIFEVSENVMKMLSATESPQGIVAELSCSPFSFEDLKAKEDSFLAIVDGVQDPGNLGSIIRSSDSAGAYAVIVLPGTCDVFANKTVRATAGSIFNLPVVFGKTDVLLKWLSRNSIKLAVTSVKRGDDIFSADLKGSLAIALGNEAHGVSRQIMNSADLLIRIPVYGKAESLNVGVAAAICLYEAARQRRLA